MSYPEGVLAPTEDYPWPSLKFDIPLLKKLSDRTVQPGNQYEFGGKVDPDADSSEVADDRIDCSSYSRWLVRRTTGVLIPEGSVNQHDWVKKLGFKPSTVDSAKLLDDYVRIAFLPPGTKAGHVVLIRNGMTFESAGGTGPVRKPWTGDGWQGRMTVKVYVLGRPS